MKYELYIDNILKGDFTCHRILSESEAIEMGKKVLYNLTLNKKFKIKVEYNNIYYNTIIDKTNY